MATLFAAALSAQIPTTGTELKLLPAGTFRARDGRPKDCAAWNLDGEHAERLVAAAAARNTRFVIDYEHQTLNAAKNGQPAPASGWFKELEWREGDGLYATDVKWTARASTMIDDDEYAYISPVFLYDKAGNVAALLHAGLVNDPGLDCLDEVQRAAACSSQMGQIDPAALAALSTQPIEAPNMDELLEQLRWLLNMPVGATADDVTAQLKKLITALAGEQGTAALSANIPVLIESQKTQIAALKSNQVDPAKHVPIEVMVALRAELDAANARLGSDEVNGLIAAALKDGRLLPAQEAWARGLGDSNVAALKTFLDTAPKIAALSNQQTGGAAPEGMNTPALGDADMAVCKSLGLDLATYKPSTAAA